MRLSACLVVFLVVAARGNVAAQSYDNLTSLINRLVRLAAPIKMGPSSKQFGGLFLYELKKQTVQPTSNTTIQPTSHTTLQPTSHTTLQPTSHTTLQPTSHTTVQPTSHTTVQPTNHTVQPTNETKPSFYFCPMPSNEAGGLLINKTNRFAPTNLTWLNNYLVALPVKKGSNKSRNDIHVEDFVLRLHGDNLIQNYTAKHRTQPRYAVVYTYWSPCDVCTKVIVNFAKNHTTLNLTLAYTAPFNNNTTQANNNINRIKGANVTVVRVCYVPPRRKRSAYVTTCEETTNAAAGVVAACDAMMQCLLLGVLAVTAAAWPRLHKGVFVQ